MIRFYGCGSNNCGQLGTSDLQDRIEWTELPSLFGSSLVTCGGTHGVAIRENSVFGWGDYSHGEVLRNFEHFAVTSPVSVVCGWRHTLVLEGVSVCWFIIHDKSAVQGSVFVCGSNTSSQIDTGVSASVSLRRLPPSVCSDNRSSCVSNIVTGRPSMMNLLSPPAPECRTACVCRMRGRCLRLARIVIGCAVPPVISRPSWRPCFVV